MMGWYGILLIIGFIALVKGADWFVESSSSLARKFHISGVIIGLTIVAFGTSAPELAVSTLAAFSGSNEIALSNVVGSNIFNILFILGVSATIHPLEVNFATFCDILILIVMSGISYLFALSHRHISRREGACMLVAYVAIMAFAIVR